MSNQLEDLLCALEDVCGAIQPSQINKYDIFLMARKGDKESLKRNLEIVTDINKRNLLGGSGRSILHEATIFNKNTCVELILEFGQKTRNRLDVNQPSLFGKETALHFAVGNNNKEAAFILLHFGANPNKRNKYGETSLHLCTDEGMASLLITFGALTSMVDSNDQFPVDHALAKGYKKTSKLVKVLTGKEKVHRCTLNK